MPSGHRLLAEPAAIAARPSAHGTSRQHHALHVESSRRFPCRKFWCVYRSGKLGFAGPWLLGAVIVCQDRMTIARTVLQALAVRC